MAAYPSPHSAERFAVLDAFNSVQVVHTRKTVKSVGCADVWSVCGDGPAKDFKIAAKSLPAEAVASIRLRDECRGIRSSMNGGVYEAL